MPSIFFVRKTKLTGGGAASDANDGKDAHGLSLTTAAWATGDSGTTGTLTKTGQFASVAVDDILWISSATASQNGWYKCTATGTDAITLRFVTGTKISSNQTDVTSSDGPWLTLQKGADTVTQPNELRICDDSWTLSVTLNFTTNSGSISGADGWVYIIGANNRGVLDGTVVSINCTGQTVTNTASVNVTVSSVQFHNISVENSPGNAWRMTTNGATLRWVNCKALTPSSNGWVFTISQRSVTFVSCEARGAVNSGSNNGSGIFFATTNASTQGILISGCKLHHNARAGLMGQLGPITVAHTLIYANSMTGVTVDRAIALHNCVIDGNGGAGVVGANGSAAIPTILSNCAVTNNGGWGFDGSVGNRTGSNNLFYNNTSGHVAGLSESYDILRMFPNSILGEDPLYTSRVNNSEDFTPQAGSPLLGGGV
jgi:hypothetical protein